MVVCVEPELGLFFRINTKGHWPGSILIERRLNPFLQYDSYLECGSIIELDEFIVDEVLDDKGIYGELSPKIAAEICKAVRFETTFRQSDKDAICRCLGN